MTSFYIAGLTCRKSCGFLDGSAIVHIIEGRSPAPIPAGMVRCRDRHSWAMHADILVTCDPLANELNERFA